MTRTKKIVQAGVQDYLTQIFALILYKPRTLHPKSLDWPRSQKTHTVTETQRERERQTDRERASERDSEREEKRERLNVAANECQGMLYIFSPIMPHSIHGSASFNSTLAKSAPVPERGAYILKNVARAKVERP